MDDEIYCHRECNLFPRTEFHEAKNGQLIHKRGTLHYTNGHEVFPKHDPTLSGMVQALIKKRKAALQMSDDQVAELSAGVKALTDKRKDALQMSDDEVKALIGYLADMIEP
jgi:hypothetical protein